MRLLALTLGALLLASTARAQSEPEPEVPQAERAVARTQYNQGVEHAAAGRWEQARQSFQRAADIAPFAAIVYNLAAAQSHTGHFVEAAENYRTFLRRRRSTEEDLSALRAEADRELQAVLLRVGRLTLRIGNLHDADVVQLDERPISHALLDTAMPINPGQHTLRVLRGTDALDDRAFDIREGQPTTLELTVPVFTATSERAGGGTTPPITQVTELTWLWVTLGAVGGAALIAILIGAGVAAGGGGSAPYPGNLGEPVRLPLTLARF